MAEIRRITRSNPQSNFQNVAPATGGVFRVLADTAQTAYEALRPGAIKAMTEEGAALGRDLARQQIGDPLAGINLPSTGGAPGQPSSRAEGVSDAAAASFAALETAYGKPLRVNSAYRSPEKNAAVGGAKGSQHMHGNAFDVDVADLSTDERNALIRLARSSGFRGIGVYNNSLHFDVGGDRAWGPSYGRESLPSWAAEAVQSPIGGVGQPTVSTSGGEPSQPFTPVMLREADGSLTSRMFSPMAGEILQAHNAAAGIAYNADVIMKGQVDLMGLSEQFMLDPQGFQQAARGYVDDLVKGAPEVFREELRSTLETEAQRRTLGILEDRHRDIRQRADNSSRALADNQASQLSAAIAGGDLREIAAARAQLQGTLQARESLPGIAWTPEQSYNTMRAAEEEGRRVIADRQKEATKKAKDSFSLIAKAASEGLAAADESILDNPEAQALDPDGFREAAAAVALREALPNLGAATPAEAQSALAEFKATPVTDDFQIGMIKAAEAYVSNHAKAFAEDPIAAATTYLPEKPVPLPAFDPNNPQAYIQALAARGTYAAGLVEGGYTEDLTLVSKEEAKQLGAVFGKETPAELKAAMATAIVSGLGGDAAAFFKNIGAEDPVLLHLGQLAAAGGAPEVTLEGFRGAELLRTGQARKPTNAGSIAEVSPDIAMALAGVPADVLKVSDQVFQSALAVAAARYPQTADPKSEEAQMAMTEALQSVLGQSKDLSGNLTGGVQPIAGKPTLLPAGMRGKDLNAALRAAFPRGASEYVAMDPGASPIWGASPPMLEGKPLKDYHYDLMVLTPAGGNSYRLSLNVSGQIVDVRNASGQAYTFDAQAVIDNWRTAKTRTAPVPSQVGTYSGDPAAEVQVPTP